MTILEAIEKNRLICQIKTTINDLKMHKRCQLRLTEKWKRTRQLSVRCDLKIVHGLAENSMNQLKELQKRLDEMKEQLNTAKKSSAVHFGSILPCMSIQSLKTLLYNSRPNLSFCYLFSIRHYIQTRLYILMDMFAKC